MSRLEKIFSVKNEGNHKVLTICGIKVKVKSKLRELHSELMALRDAHRELQENHWELRREFNGFNYQHNQFEFVFAMWRNGANEALLNYFDLVARSPHAWRSYHHQFWLIYLACLIEVGNTEKAQDILQRYVIYRDLLDIERFLPVAKFALENGIFNEEIRKAAFVSNKLLENHKKDLFKKVFEGKTIAIVGNGPSEIGKNKGKEIDAHDVVVRFNSYKIAGFENDYGSKTDVWARGTGMGEIPDRKEEYDLIVWANDFDHWKVFFDHLDVLYRQLTSSENVCNVGFATHFALKKASKLDNPTTGMVFVWEIYEKLGGFKNVDFYGFNFCQEEWDTYSTHYFNDRSEEDAKGASVNHRIDKEAQFLVQLIGRSGR